MAIKMKNGLRRVQFYLSENSYASLLIRIRQSGLTESAFCANVITGEKPLTRGAPLGNQNKKNTKDKKNFQMSLPGTAALAEAPESAVTEAVGDIDLSGEQPGAISLDRRLAVDDRANDLDDPATAECSQNPLREVSDEEMDDLLAELSGSRSDGVPFSDGGIAEMTAHHLDTRTTENLEDAENVEITFA